jgi:hypothetical protein
MLQRDWHSGIRVLHPALPLQVVPHPVKVMAGHLGTTILPAAPGPDINLLHAGWVIGPSALVNIACPKISEDLRIPTEKYLKHG